MSKSQQPTAPGLTFRLNLARPSVALSGSLLIGLSLWLLASPTLAEVPYHVARKIPRHSRTSVQQVVPASMNTPDVPQLDSGASSINSSEAQATESATSPVTAKITKSASPAPDNAKPSTTVTVSAPQKVYPPEPSPSELLDTDANSLRAAESPASKKAALPLDSVQSLTEQVQQALPQAPAISQTTQSVPASEATRQALGETANQDAKQQAKLIKPAVKQARQGHNKKAHPVVIAPEPLLPATEGQQTAAGQNNPGSWENENPTGAEAQAPPAQTVVTSLTPSASGKTFTTKATKTAEATPSADSAKAPLLGKAIASGKSVNATSAHPRTASTWENPHTSARTGGSKIHTWEPGFYPVGYTPAIRPVTSEKMQALGNALSHYNRGVYYVQRQEWDKAVSEYKQVLSQNINMADAYVGLSTAAIYQHDWENALKNSVKALRLKNGFIDPSNITQARYNLSSVYCVSDDYKKSLRYFKLVKKDNHPQTDTLWSFIQNTCQPSNAKKNF